jgi:hypothetical protein
MDIDFNRMGKHMSRHPRYLRLRLGKIIGPEGRSVQELAHRFVLWAVYGPPASRFVRPVAMHICNNDKCLNPEHLVWGEDKENKAGEIRANREARRELREQRGLDLGAWLDALNLQDPGPEDA